MDYFDSLSYQKAFWLAAADMKDVWLNKVGSLIGHLTVGLIDIFVQHRSTFKTKFLVCCYCSKFYIFKVKFCFIVKTVLVFAALLEFATFMLNTFGVSLWGFILYCFIIFVFLSMSILNLEFLNWRFETVYNFFTFLFDYFSSKEIETFFTFMPRVFCWNINSSLHSSNFEEKNNVCLLCFLSKIAKYKLVKHPTILFIFKATRIYETPYYDIQEQI